MIPQQPSEFQLTLSALEDRVHFFQANHISAENQLAINNNNYSIRTLAQIFPPLKNCRISQTPLQPHLSDIYQSSYQQVSLRYILPPASDGQNSINEQQNFQPTFKWLCSSLIDSTLLMTDQIQAKKIEKGKIPQEWNNIKQLLIHNVSQKIYLKSEVRQAEAYLFERFEKYPWVKLKKVKQLFYKGKPSFILRFADIAGSSFAYYNLSKKLPSIKEMLGDKLQVYRITQNRIKFKPDKWVGILFRNLPASMSKQSFVAMLKKNQLPIVWLQELIQIGDFKYTFCRVNYLQQAFQICSFFQMKSPLKQLKVNLNPKSTKVWQSKQQLHITQ